VPVPVPVRQILGRARSGPVSLWRTRRDRASIAGNLSVWDHPHHVAFGCLGGRGGAGREGTPAGEGNGEAQPIPRRGTPAREELP